MIFDFCIDGDYYFIVMKFVIKNFNVVYYMFLYGCDDNGNIYIFIVQNVDMVVYVRMLWLLIISMGTFIYKKIDFKRKRKTL